MELRPLTPGDVQACGLWRNESLASLRTPEMSTYDSQARWFASLETPGCPHRYWSLTEFDSLVGVGGLTYISWENRSAEISLIIDPSLRGKGYGKEAVSLLLNHAFKSMNLEIVYGEVYDCGTPKFWNKVLPPGTEFVRLPARKYWDGKYWDSTYFSVRKA